MRNSRKIMMGAMLVATSLAVSMAQAQGHDRDRRGERRGDRIDRGDRYDRPGRRGNRQVVRRAQVLADDMFRLSRMVQRQATRYRPVERRALRMVKKASRSADLLARRARATRGQGRGLRMLLRETRWDFQDAARMIRRANFNFRADRQVMLTRDSLQRLARALRHGGGRDDRRRRRP